MQHWDLTDQNISAVLKSATLVLDYPSQGIPTDHIDMHSLQSEDTNALTPSQDTQTIRFKKCVARKELPSKNTFGKSAHFL